MMESMVFIFLGALLGMAGGALYLALGKKAGTRIYFVFILLISGTAGIITAIALFGNDVSKVTCSLMIITGFLVSYLVEDLF